MNGTERTDGAHRGASEIEPLGALAHANLAASTEGEGADGGLTFKALPPTGLLTLRGDARSSPLAAALEEVTSLALPGRLTSIDDGTRVLRWMSPDEWLLSMPLEDVATLEKDIGEAIARGEGRHAGVLDVSGGYALFELGGPALRAVLAASTTYDVHPDNFPPGKVVNTDFAKTGVTLRAIDDARVELIVRRSLADYAWTWLQRAAREYGLSVRD